MIKDAHKVSKIIGWPGKPDIKVKMRLLTLSETRISKVQNQQEFKKDGLEIGSHNWADYREQECVHGMWRILLDPETDKPIFNSAEDLRSFCTTDELNAISAEYNAFADAVDPLSHRLDRIVFEVELLESQRQIVERLNRIGLEHHRRIKIRMRVVIIAAIVVNQPANRKHFRRRRRDFRR